MAAQLTSVLWKKLHTDVYYLCSHSGFECRDGACNDAGRQPHLPAIYKKLEHSPLHISTSGILSSFDAAPEEWQINCLNCQAHASSGWRFWLPFIETTCQSLITKSLNIGDQQPINQIISVTCTSYGGYVIPARPDMTYVYCYASERTDVMWVRSKV